MGITNPPEDRYHGRKQNVTYSVIFREKMKPRLWYRFNSFYTDRIREETKLNQFLWRHSQRTHVAPYWFAFLFFSYIGSLFHYYNYKKNVVEDKWVQEYGQDVPHFRKFWFATKVQRIRAEYVHFYRYRLFYFIEEQVIDPLNDNSLTAKAFDVYQFKRLIRL